MLEEHSELDDSTQKSEVSLDIRDWVPYRVWLLSQKIGFRLERFYSEKFQLNGSQWRCLAMIACQLPLSAKELAHHLDLDQVQTTRVTTKLEQKGMIERHSDKRDRRKVIFKLSEHGLQTFNQITPKAQEIQAELFSVLDNDNKNQFIALLSQLEEQAARLES